MTLRKLPRGASGTTLLPGNFAALTCDRSSFGGGKRVGRLLIRVFFTCLIVNCSLK